MTGLARMAAAGPAIAGLALAGGCASLASSTGSRPVAPVADSTIVLDERAGNATVRVVVGQDVEVLLHSTYWTDFGSSKPSVVHIDGAPKVLPSASPCVPGGGCAPVLARFTAARAGTAVLSASRTSCGEALACGPKDGHYRVTIVVAAR